MQLTPLGPRSPAASPAPGERAGGPDATNGTAARSAAPLRGGLRSGATLVNQQIAGAQQAKNYLDQLAAQLQHLKSQLSRQLAQQRDEAATTAATTATAAQAADTSITDDAHSTSPGSMQARLQSLNALWRERPALAGGRLNSQLAYSEAEPAQQQFKVRGLELATLQRGERESLQLALDTGIGRRQTVSVTVEPGLTRQALVRRFDQALAPAGVRAATDANGELLFSVPEALWAGVQESLAIKGSGVSFPTGQLHRVKAEPEAAALRPELWRADSKAGLRSSLQQVMAALDRVRAAQDVVSRALTRAAQELSHTAAPADTAWADAFTEQFGQLAAQPGYQAFSSVAPALIGISRDRVMAILSST